MVEWTNSRTPDGQWSGKEFSSREEAIEDGILQHCSAMQGFGTDLFDDEDEQGRIPNVFYIGRITEWHPNVDGGDAI